MNIEKHMSQDDLVRRWSSDAAINWDDSPPSVWQRVRDAIHNWALDCDDAGEGGFIAALAVVLFVLIALGSFIAVVLS